MEIERLLGHTLGSLPVQIIKTLAGTLKTRD